MSDTTVKISKHWAVRIEENDIRRMHGLISRFLEEDATVNVDFYNNTSISSKDVNEIIEDTNNLGSRIKRISIRGSRYSIERGHKSANIILLDETVIHVMSSEATGDNSSAMAFRHDMNNTMAPCRLWYSPWHYSDIINFLFCMGVAFAFFVLLLNHVTINKDYTGLILPAYAIAGVALWFAAKLIIFPRMTFYIGISKRRADIRQSIGKYILISILGGLVIGVSGNFLTDSLKDYLAKKP